MDKSQLLNIIRVAAEQKIITKNELTEAYEAGVATTSDSVLARPVSISEVLYYLGGLIVFVGISVLVWQHWGTLTPLLRILVTLGTSIVAYSIGAILGSNKNLDSLGHAFHVIAALVMPLGIAVTADALGIRLTTAAAQSVVTGLLFFVYLMSYFIIRKHLFVIFALLYGTLLFFSFTEFLVGGGPYFPVTEFIHYRIMIVGISYILLGNYFSQTPLVGIIEFIFSLGVLGVLGPALALGGWSPNPNVFWELIYPGLALGSVFLSFYFKSRAFILFGTLFLMAYILKISAEYFSQSLGWPISLVLAGLLLIGVGYLAFALNKKITPHVQGT